MAWNIEKTDDGQFAWSFVNTGYGAISGTSPTLAEAKVELYIGQCEVLEEPLPDTIVKVMRADPEHFAKDFPDPEGIDG